MKPTENGIRCKLSDDLVTKLFSFNVIIIVNYMYMPFEKSM